MPQRSSLLAFLLRAFKPALSCAIPRAWLTFLLLFHLKVFSYALLLSLVLLHVSVPILVPFYHRIVSLEGHVFLFCSLLVLPSL